MISRKLEGRGHMKRTIDDSNRKDAHVAKPVAAAERLGIPVAYPTRACVGAIDSSPVLQAKIWALGDWLLRR